MFLGKKIAFIRDNGEIDIQALLRNHPVYKYHDDQADQTHRRWYRLSASGTDPAAEIDQEYTFQIPS